MIIVQISAASLSRVTLADRSTPLESSQDGKCFDALDQPALGGAYDRRKFALLEWLGGSPDVVSLSHCAREHTGPPSSSSSPKIQTPKHGSRSGRSRDAWHIPISCRSSRRAEPLSTVQAWSISSPNAATACSRSSFRIALSNCTRRAHRLPRRRRALLSACQGLRTRPRQAIQHSRLRRSTEALDR